jgi:hypothetical protein
MNCAREIPIWAGEFFIKRHPIVLKQVFADEVADYCEQ